MKNSQVAVLTVVAFSCVAVLVWALASPERLAAIIGQFQERPQEEICLDLAKERLRLKDPDSAKVVSHTTLSNGDVEIRFKAANSFGAFVTVEYGCHIYDGKAMMSSAQIKRDMDELGLSVPK